MFTDATIIRQPILDRNMTIVGYELLLQPLQTSQQLNMSTLKALHEEHDLSTLAGGARLFLPYHHIELTDELLTICTNPQNLVIEVTSDIAHQADKLRLLKHFRQHGVILTLNNYQGSEQDEKVATACQMVKIDTQAHKADVLYEMVKHLHSKQLQVIADNVEQESDFDILKTQGFDLFQGFFFTNPIILHGKKLSANKLNLLQLLAKLNKDQTDFHELVDIIGHDLALTHKLLTAINHPHHNLPIQVTSIADAIRYMGMQRLKLWVSMILMAESDDKPQALMEISLIRAKFCEILAEHTNHKAEKDSYFLVGLFSTLGAYFNLPQAEVLDELPLAPHLKEAMLEHNGKVGQALWVSKQFETPYADLCTLTYEGLDIMGLSNDYLSATKWGHDILRVPEPVEET